MHLFYAEDYDGSREESRALLGQAMDRYFQKENRNPEASTKELLERICVGNLGKPYIPGFVPYSISHTGRYWAVLFSETPCGLDIQKWQKSNYMKLAERFYQEDEIQSVRENGEAEFFRIWARREAFRKALGLSVFTEAESVLSDCANHAGERYRLQDVKMPFLCDAAICVQLTEENSAGMECNLEAERIEIERL